MSDPRTTPCTSCGAEIFFKYTESGKRMPLNPDPVDEPVAGTYRIEGALCLGASPMFDPPGSIYYLNHWATCPTRDLHRSSK